MTGFGTLLGFRAQPPMWNKVGNLMHRGLQRLGKSTRGQFPELDADQFVTRAYRSSVELSAKSGLELDCPELAPPRGEAASQAAYLAFTLAVGKRLAESGLVSSPLTPLISTCLDLIEPSQERRWGERLHETMIRSGEVEVLDDEPRRQRLQGLADQLTERRDFEVVVARLGDKLGAALPGKVYVDPNYTEHFTQDGEAALLGHEIGHLEHRDSVRRLAIEKSLEVIQRAASQAPEETRKHLHGLADEVSQMSKAVIEEQEEGAWVFGREAIDRAGLDHSQAMRDMTIHRLTAVFGSREEALETVDPLMPVVATETNWGRILFPGQRPGF